MKPNSLHQLLKKAIKAHLFSTCWKFKGDGNEYYSWVSTSPLSGQSHKYHKNVKFKITLSLDNQVFPKATLGCRHATNTKPCQSSNNATIKAKGQYNQFVISNYFD